MTQRLSDIISEEKSTILNRWFKKHLAQQDEMEGTIRGDELRAQINELLDELKKAMGSEEDALSPQKFEPARGLIQHIAKSWTNKGFTARETGMFILGLKEVLNDILQKHITDSQTELVQAIITMNMLLDNLSMLTFDIFISSREEIIDRQSEEITEISTPVIRVWEGVVALPIIGTLDSQRAQVIMESLLQEIVDTGSGIAILDISGVPTVDSLVAQHLIKTANAAKLMGAECIISGIKPEIAQTIVHLGIDLSSIKTKGSMASALLQAFAINGYEVRKNNSASEGLL